MNERITRIDPEVAGDKVARIAKEGIYRIATGAWSPGARLPTIREGNRLWGANQVTVLRAYKQLEAMRLIRSVPQKGFFVETGSDIRRLTQHRAPLERLFHSFLDRIREETELSGLGAFRYLSRLAEEHFREFPECVFVECTEFQSRQLADSLAARLDIPCEPLPLSDLGPRGRGVPEHVRLLVTTGYHYAEVVEALGEQREVHKVSVRFDPAAVRTATAGIERLSVFCLDADQGRHIAEDYRRMSGNEQLEADATSADIDTITPILEERFTPLAGTHALLLSPSLWEAVPQTWRDHDRTHPYHTEVSDNALTDIADALGLPLGGLG